MNRKFKKRVGILAAFVGIQAKVQAAAYEVIYSPFVVGVVSAQLMTVSPLFGDFVEKTETLVLPEGSFLPGFRDFISEEIPSNPFVSEAFEFKNEIEIVNTELFSDFLRSQISGYVESESFSKSALLLSNGRMVFIGETLEIDKAPGVEEEGITLTLKFLRSPFAAFAFDEKGSTLSLDASNTSPDPLKSGPSFIQEKGVTRGLIVHSDGWIVAPIGDLNPEQSLIVYIRDIPYPTKLVGTFEEEGLVILKIFSKKSTVKLPFILISFEVPQTGETLHVQESFGAHPPYLKQIAHPEDARAPAIEQDFGVATLNNRHELVALNLKTKISQDRLLKHLGSLIEIEKPFTKKALTDLPRASVTIVCEE